VPAAAGGLALEIAMRVLDGLECTRLGADEPLTTSRSRAAA
jgi:hypothetical protein